MAPTRSVKVVLTANASQFMSTLGQASNASKQFGQNLSGSISKNEQSLNKLAGGAGKVGLGLAVGLGAAVNSAAGFDQAMSRVAASGDDARGSLDSLRTAAIDAGAKTSFSANEAAAGIENLAKAGVSANDILGGGLSGTLDLAAAGQLGVADAAEIAATAMTQFNLSGEQIPHVADLLAAGAGKAQGSVEDIGMALKQSGLVASSFGISIEDTTGTLAAFADAGLIGSDAGTSFKSMLQQLANPSKESAAQMKELGIAAYDTQGNFVGVTDLAGQLQDKMSKLTPAVRDQALAQIFGSDAVRAANVLYKEGAGGLQTYIDQTNDAGYAAKSAGILMDNLKGDLEGLSGSFQTALINLGKGADGPLRKLTQGLTDAVNKFGAMDGSSQETALRVGAVGAASLLAVSGVSKLAMSANDTLSAFRDLRTNSPGAAKAVSGVGKAAGAAAIAFAALQGVGIVTRQFRDNFVPSIEESNKALLDLAATGKTADLDKLFDFDIAGFGSDALKGANDVDGLGMALTRIKDSGSIATGGLDLLRTKIDGFIGTTGVLTGVRDQFAALDKSLTTLPADEAAAAFKKVADAAAAQGLPVKDLTALFPAYAEQTRESARANEYHYTSAQTLADAMGGKIPSALKAARTAMSKTITTTDGVTLSTDTLEGKTEELRVAQGKLAAETQKVINKFTILKNGALDQEDANNAWQASIDAVKQSVKENGKSLDSHSAKGRANRSVVKDMITALDAKVTADFKADVATMGLKKATEKASEALRVGKKRIDETTGAAKLSKDEVKRMQDRFLQTPKELKTQVKTPGSDAAKEEIRKLQERIADLKNKDVAVDVKLSSNYKKVKADFDLKFPQSRALGGPILNLSGKGRKGVDTELVLAAYGEHMLDNQDVEAMGGHEGVYRIRQAAKRGELRGFKNGGAVTRSVNVNTDSSPVPALVDMSAWSKQIGSYMAKSAVATMQSQVTAAAKAAQAESYAGGSYGAPGAGKYGGSRLNSEQLKNAAIIASVGSSMGERAIRVGLMTALQESTLRNLSGGDRDSVGLFQQRAPWGPFSARHNPRESAKMFFHGGRGGQRGLDDIPDWQRLSNGAAAQRVQVSAFPGAYAKWSDEASAILGSLKAGGGGGGGGGNVGTGSSRRVRWKGGNFTEKFVNTLKAAERISGQTFSVTQGGFRPRTSYSGTSHQGDAVDLPWYGSNVVNALRKVNVAAWHRSPYQGPWNHHIHGVPLPGAGYPKGSAVWQGQDYRRGGNGLSAGGLVPGWSPNPKADNIPIMATAREFMQPVRAVDYYGVEAMEALRRLSIPRDELKRLLGRKGLTPRTVDPSHGPVGMADGGLLRRKIVQPSYAAPAPFYRTAFATAGAAPTRPGPVFTGDFHGPSAEDIGRDVMARQRRWDALHPTW